MTCRGWLAACACLLLAASPAQAAIAITEKLNEFSGTDIADGSPYTTAGTFTIANNALGLCGVFHTAATNGNLRTVSSVTGGSVTTWTEVGSVGFNSVASPVRRITVFRGMGAGASAATLSVNFATGADQTSAGVACFEVTGVDTGGVNGAEAVAQFKTEASDSATETSPTFDNALTATAGIIQWSMINADRNWTADAGLQFTLGTDAFTGWTSPATDARTQWDASSTDDTPSMTISGGATVIASIAVEVTEDGGGGGGGAVECAGMLLRGVGRCGL
jgi:hypothetical protein